LARTLSNKLFGSFVWAQAAIWIIAAKLHRNGSRVHMIKRILFFDHEIPDV